jgi:putative DNA primase/helicase
VESLAVRFEPLAIGDRIAAAKTYDLQPTTYPPIPLENCLAKSNRELLNGVSQGLRNESGAKLARDLIGSENHLRDLGVGFTGNAIELFDLFASRCSPPISTGESITIWKSAERDNPTPSCKADGIANILTAWERKHSSTKSGSDGSTIASSLLSRGYGYNPKHKRDLIFYLHSLGSKIERTYTITEASGWVNGSFVLPHQTIGDETLRFRDVEPSPDAITETKGTLLGWRDGVAAKCAGNSRLILALGVSFTAPLLPILDIESGGFHLVGVSSTGKTTSLRVAASVTGVKEIPHWRTTTNGLESIATTFNHLCLPLDEILQADAKDVGNIAYMLANGQGKARMNKNLTNRQNKTWQLIFLSSGEVGLGSYMEQAKIAIKGGQEVRLPDIPAEPKVSNYGCFETIHQYEDPVRFIEALESAANTHHGTAIEAFLSQLVIDRTNPQFAKDLIDKVISISSKLSEGTKSSQVGRVAKRFALVQVALGLAHQYGLLPFPVEQIDWAISTIFSDWLDSRGGDGSIEIKRVIDSISLLLTKSEMTDRCVVLLKDGKAWKRPDDKRVTDFLAYRVVEGKGNTGDRTLEFWVPQNIFDDEFCDGVDKSELVKVLQQMGWLELNSDGRPHQKTVNGERDRFFIFRIWKKAVVQMVQLVQLASNIDE